jgi:hypothetical protein
VREDVGVVAARFFQGIGEDGKAGVVQQPGGEKPVVVGGSCELKHGGRQPGRGEGDGAEGVSDDVTEERSLFY